MLYAGEHVLETVTEFVKQGFNFSERHQRGLACHRWRSIAGQVRHRLATHHFALANANIHPCSAALVCWAGVGIEEEGRDVLPSFIVLQFAILLRQEESQLCSYCSYLDVEKAHIWMPDLGLAICCFNGDAKQSVGQCEHAVQYRR